MIFATPHLPTARPAAFPRAGGSAARAAAARAFTLVELMISIALVLVIILGVNAIFKMASDTVNAGQALSSANRDNRAIQAVIYQDFQNAVLTDSPMLLIRSERVASFRNKADELADRDYNPSGSPGAQDLAIRTTDYNNNNVEGEGGIPGELTAPLVYNSRNHRIDRVGFFASHLYRRQTGTDATTGGTRFMDDLSSMEAYIWYGHLAQPDFGKPLATAGRFEHRSPGELPRDRNANNFYATDWILGRCVTLLREQIPAQQNYIEFNPNPPARLTPLSPDSESALPGIKDNMSWSRYDVAHTSINAFRGTLQGDIGLNGYNISAKPWYALLGGEWGTLGNARFQGYAYPDRPLSAYGLARTVPVFVRGCTQFIVEFAGDYLAQNFTTGGTITGTYLPAPTGGTLTQGTDGEIDYVVVNEQSNPNDPVRQVRRIRWYGMPRNVDITDDVAGPMIAGGTSKQNLIHDVVPLRDLLVSAGLPAPLPQSDYFEHFAGGLETVRTNYAAPGAVSDDPHLLRYYAAWGPNDLRKGSPTRPKMLRITMTVDDPNGRLTEGQTFEYVIDLP